ncbi:MAG: hypothetical protein QM768_16015 [Agriterribacter sp.]
MRYAMIWSSVCILIIQLIADNAKAQVNTPDAENVFKVNIIAPGVSYEKRIGYRQTLVAGAYLAPNFVFSYSSNFAVIFILILYRVLKRHIVITIMETGGLIRGMQPLSTT